LFEVLDISFVSCPSLYCLFPSIHLSLLIQDGATSLMLASSKGHDQIVHLLLDAGAGKDVEDNVSFPFPLF